MSNQQPPYSPYPPQGAQGYQQTPLPGQQPPLPGQQPPLPGQGYPPQFQQPYPPYNQPGQQQFPPHAPQPGQYPPPQTGQQFPTQPGYAPYSPQPGYQPYFDPTHQQQPGYYPPPPQNARFIVHAWNLFFNFPVEVTVPSSVYIDTVVREACHKAQVPYNNVMGLKIKPGKTKKSLQKAEFLPPNLLVSQVLQAHEFGPDQPLHVHLDLMPPQGLILTKSPKAIYFDYSNLEIIKSNIKFIAEAIVSLMNTEGGHVFIGVGQDCRIKGTNVNQMKSQQLHHWFIQELQKGLIQPSSFPMLIKVKTHPITTAQSQPTNLAGIMIQVEKWKNPTDLFSCDYVFYKKTPESWIKIAPHDLVALVQLRKGKDINKQKSFGQK